MSSEASFDYAAIFKASIPMVRTLNLDIQVATGDKAVVRMPDQTDYHNHIGGLHAGAMFTLAESASGVLIVANFMSAGVGTPLAVNATMNFLKVAKGDITATATMNTTRDAVIAELEAGKRPEFSISVELHDDNGLQTGSMEILWTLKPHKKPEA